MLRIALGFAAGAVVAMVIGFVPAFSQDDRPGMGGRDDTGRTDKPKTDTSKTDGAGIVKPGPEHGWLGESSGRWNVTGQRWASDGADPVSFEGETNLKMLNDRYLYEEYSVGQGENQMNGFSIIGYNPSTKQYQMVHAGNTTQGMYFVPGTRTGNTITFNSTEGDMKSRTVLTRTDSNQTTLTTYHTPNGKAEYKAMELKYTRAR